VTSARRRSGGRSPSAEVRIGAFARIDVDRGRRTGAPEVILAEGKSVDHLVGLLAGLARRGHGVFISRPTAEQTRRLVGWNHRGRTLEVLAGGRLLRLPGTMRGHRARGTVAVITAGTADVPVAEEAVALLVGHGVRVVSAHDVGVAGIHRTESALRRLARAHPSVYLVFAGREGALPTVVAGLVRAPVVGVPTSVGYGRGGRGEAALNAMLQSCAPLAVVNIDAAVPAALFALQLLGASSSAPGNRATR
jgi:NCAIR mutase (PurE)-related protein